ncbi:putative mitochondrial basic amino acids transporter [Apostichopus japonicus]|uniref:Putative mitochondrial basic amino acids transporter n=1 Tax=Stichopus japonicus TaxID=307972 RepID=A0A2G8JY32_STIJA|nr:putative mitochondrial basic amino acids transporter [Apostichopus japonicus]
MLSLTFINALVFGVQANVMRLFDTRPCSATGRRVPRPEAIQSVIAGQWNLPRSVCRWKVSERWRRANIRIITGQSTLCRRSSIRKGSGDFIGYMCTLLRDSPAFGFYFVSYEAMCRQFAKYSEHVMSVLDSYSSREVSVGVVLVLDLRPGRGQDAATSRRDQRAARYSGAVDVIKQTFRDEGLRGFYRGLGITLVRAVPRQCDYFYRGAVHLRF